MENPLKPVPELTINTEPRNPGGDDSMLMVLKSNHGAEYLLTIAPWGLTLIAQNEVAHIQLELEIERAALELNLSQQNGVRWTPFAIDVNAIGGKHNHAEI